MHLHWKYRELVKIISNETNVESVHQVARILEAESGGILVAVERVSKGYAIIVYRGKNYERPACLRPQTLLSKREAMKRSLEEQRRKVKLTYFVMHASYTFYIVCHLKEEKIKTVEEKGKNRSTFTNCTYNSGTKF